MKYSLINEVEEKKVILSLPQTIMLSDTDTCLEKKSSEIVEQKLLSNQLVEIMAIFWPIFEILYDYEQPLGNFTLIKDQEEIVESEKIYCGALWICDKYGAQFPFPSLCTIREKNVLRELADQERDEVNPYRNNAVRAFHEFRKTKRNGYKGPYEFPLDDTQRQQDTIYCRKMGKGLEFAVGKSNIIDVITPGELQCPTYAMYARVMYIIAYSNKLKTYKFPYTATRAWARLYAVSSEYRNYIRKQIKSHLNRIFEPRRLYLLYTEVNLYRMYKEMLAALDRLEKGDETPFPNKYNFPFLPEKVKPMDILSAFYTKNLFAIGPDSLWNSLFEYILDKAPDPRDIDLLLALPDIMNISKIFIEGEACLELIKKHQSPVLLYGLFKGDTLGLIKKLAASLPVPTESTLHLPSYQKPLTKFEMVADIKDAPPGINRNYLLALGAFNYLMFVQQCLREFYAHNPFNADKLLAEYHQKYLAQSTDVNISFADFMKWVHADPLVASHQLSTSVVSTSLPSAQQENKSIPSHNMDNPAPVPSSGYDLVLMSINDKQKIDLQRVEKYVRENKELQRNPIVVIQGEEFSIYGVSEKGEWRLTHGLKLKTSQFRESKYAPQSEVKLSNRIQTQGGGDCALHAILGDWNPSEEELVCADIKGKREQVSAAIISKDTKEPLQSLIVSGVKELVMSGRHIGKFSQGLLNRYRRFLSDQKDFTSELWPRFEAALRQHPPIMEYIANKHRLHGNFSLRDQFYDALNQNEGELYGRILSLPALHGAFQEYSHLQNTEFDWNSAIDRQVKQEYAEFVGTSHVWLLPSELAIIANVFHVSVDYYPNPGALPLTLNPGEQSIVTVQFNGSNHFERLQSNYVVSLLPGNQIPKEVYQEITSKKGHIPSSSSSLTEDRLKSNPNYKTPRHAIEHELDNNQQEFDIKESEIRKFTKINTTDETTEWLKKNWSLEKQLKLEWIFSKKIAQEENMEKREFLTMTLKFLKEGNHQEKKSSSKDIKHITPIVSTVTLFDFDKMDEYASFMNSLYKPSISVLKAKIAQLQGFLQEESPLMAEFENEQLLYIFYLTKHVQRLFNNKNCSSEKRVGPETIDNEYNKYPEMIKHRKAGAGFLTKI